MPGLRAREAAQEGVWAQHVPAMVAFLAVAGQWRVVATGSRVMALGLDYAAARAGLDLAGIEMTPRLWEQVRVIEAGAMETMNVR